jgi:SWI/SNF-related matrix-associated actin-dependent regulator of chromatin subfamily A member 5
MAPSARQLFETQAAELSQSYDADYTKALAEATAEQDQRRQMREQQEQLRVKEELAAAKERKEAYRIKKQRIKAARAHRTPKPLSARQKYNQIMVEYIRQQQAKTAKLIGRNRSVTETFLTEKVLAKLPVLTKEEQEVSDGAEVDRNWTAGLMAQPESIKGSMRNYQLKGLEWLLYMHEHGGNPILADEMGLGKTLQTIAFIATLKLEHKLPGPSLVVVPLSVISNWMQEFRRWYTLACFRIALLMAMRHTTVAVLCIDSVPIAFASPLLFQVPVAACGAAPHLGQEGARTTATGGE